MDVKQAPEEYEKKLKILEKENSELRKELEQLRSSEALYRGVFDNMSSGSAVYEVINDGSTGADYLVKMFNKTSLREEGKVFEDIVGKSLLEIRPNIKEFGLVPVMKRVWETGKPAQHPITKYNDENFDSYYENNIFRTPSGEVVAIYNDVTEQKNMEQALINSEKRYELAMRFTNDGLFDWNLEDNTIYYSPSWKGMLGYEDHEIANEFFEWERLTMPADVEKSWAMLQEVIEGKRERFDREFKMAHKDGHWVDVLSRANVVFNQDGKAVRVVGTHVDITERRRAEEERARLQDQLRQAHKMEALGTLAGGIAHDFNNILAAIIGYAELACFDEDDEPRENAGDIRHIIEAAERARKLTQQILTFSRKQAAELKPLDLDSVVQKSVELLRTTISKMINIQADVEKGGHLVLGDDNQLEQMLINLSQNAADAMPDGGNLLITVKRSHLDNMPCFACSKEFSGTYIQLTVEDSGHGMSPEVMDQIFDPFFTTKEVGKGTGLGLSTAFGIIKSHGGHITCTSSPGKGTCFSVLIPLLDVQTAEVKEAAKPSVRVDGGTETILLVDDENALRETGSMILSRRGYRVLTAQTGEEGLEIYRQSHKSIDLVLLDINMPGMGGYRCLEQIIEINPSVRAIITSGYTANGCIGRVLKQGKAKFVAKPFRSAELLKTVRDFLDE